jgi:hemolysin activation/secretion protein
VKKIIIAHLLSLTSLITTHVFAAPAVHPANNPANVMNTLNQTLPGAQVPTQGEFRTTTNPQYIKHAEAVTHRVVLKEVQLLNAKIIPASVKAIFQPQIGQQVSFKDVQKMAVNLEHAYRAAGYILVQVILPPQEININSGVVQFQVINGNIKNIIFVGDNAKAAKNQLQRYAEQIETEDPISYHSIDRFLVLANQLPGIDVSATLVPDKKITGAADLLVQVEHTPYSAFYNINNRGSSNIGPYQHSIGATAYDLLGADAFSVTGSSTINSFKQLHYGSVNYDLVVDKYATEINPSITTTQTQPGGDLNDLAMIGTSTKYNLSVNQPLYTSTMQNLTVQTALYHVESKNNLYTSEPLYNDHVTALTAGINYQGSFLQTYHDITLSMTQGMPILGTPSTLSIPSVTNAKTTFTRFNVLMSNIHYVTQQVSVALNSQFQYSPDILVSSEQIGFGGAQFGQAFTSYVISGNNGAMGAIALRYDLAPRWGFKQIQPQIFYDAGTVSYATIAGTNNSSATAQSAGVGVNLQWQKRFNVGLTLAKSLSITQTPSVKLGWAGFINLTAMM